MASQKQKIYLWIMALVLILVVGVAAVYYSQQVAKSTEIARTNVHLRMLEGEATAAALTAINP